MPTKTEMREQVIGGALAWYASLVGPDGQVVLPAEGPARNLALAAGVLLDQLGKEVLDRHVQKPSDIRPTAWKRVLDPLV